MIEDPSQHPGAYIKEVVIRPKKLSITQAAKSIGVGRVALSNLLNGNSGLSEDMAAKISIAFSVDKQDLLARQRAYTDFHSKDDDKHIAVKAYAPTFLEIKATNIEEWADKIEARNLLPALIRILVNTTGAEITSSDFPAHDDAQRHGWDGYSESNSTTPWIPIGISGWEFGCNSSIKGKADKDYEGRTESKQITDTERRNTIFIFVTPRRWANKAKWVKTALAEGRWKDVRVYDALDIEQWLETSIPAQIWLGEQFGIPSEGLRSLFQFWDFWSESTNPAISPKIFQSAFVDHHNAVANWYKSEPEKPLKISAASQEEAMAFIGALDKQEGFEKSGLSAFSDRAIFISNADAVRRLSEVSKDIIPIAITEEAQKELITCFKNRHSMIVVDRSSYGAEPDITIDLPNSESFRNALEEMGIDREEIDSLSSITGNSPTILRRLQSDIPAVEKPRWAESPEIVSKIIPLIFAGAWNVSQDADQQILKLLSGKDFKEVERDVAELASLDDAPIWSEGNYRGVISKLDCLYAVSKLITKEDLENYFFAARYVLNEKDPALELPEKDRWAANIYDKVRDHSGAIRSNISENLTILAVHGDGLFGKRLGFKVSNHVTMTIRELLRDIDSELWMSQQSELPSYGEAAPEEFLAIIEDELRKDLPSFAPLFEPAGVDMFSRCNRTGMLWALETLAWDPANLSRVIQILGKLSTYTLEDNWSNKPVNSLKDILLIWKPQTAANVEQRSEVLCLLCEKYPDTGWEICIAPLKPGSSFTSGTSRPKWRSDASGAGQVLSRREANAFGLKCLELVLTWKVYDEQKLKDLVQCLHSIGNENYEKIYGIFKKWMSLHPDEDSVVDIREYVRTHTLTRRARKHSKENSNQYANGKRLYDLLEPKDVLSKNFWLFGKSWVELSPEELEVDDFDFDEKDREVERLRTDALKEIISINGLAGVIKLVLKGDSSQVIGHLLQSSILVNEELSEFILMCLRESVEHSQQMDGCVAGVLFSMDGKSRRKIIRKISNALKPHKKNIDQVVRLFKSAPFSQEIWSQLEVLGKSIQVEYWDSVYPNTHNLPSEEINFAVEKLMAAERPKAAFHLVHFHPARLEENTLIELLEKLVIPGKAASEEGYKPQQYEIEKAFETLNEKSSVDKTKLARLEYLYAEVFDQFSQYGLPNLSAEIAKSPPQFMQLNVLCFKREDEGADPPEWNLNLDASLKTQAAKRAYDVLQNINVIPGADIHGEIDKDYLHKWITDVRSLAKKLDRFIITDQQIGQLLSQSREEGKDGVWPREEIRDVFEEIESREISSGLESGIRNRRGAMASFRGEKSTEERISAEKYRSMASKIENRRPFTAAMLNRIAMSYDDEADWWEEDHRVNRRLRGW